MHRWVPRLQVTSPSVVRNPGVWLRIGPVRLRIL